MSLKLPNVHQLPHMYSWADDIQNSASVDVGDFNSLLHSIRSHGLCDDVHLSDKLHKIQARIDNNETTTASLASGSGMDVDVDSHLNDDNAVEHLEKELETLEAAVNELDVVPPAPALVTRTRTRGRMRT